MEDTQIISDNANQPVEKAGLSIFAFIIGIIGLIITLIHCICDIPALATYLGSYATNKVFFWGTFALAAVLIIVAASIANFLKKKDQGYKSLINAIPIFTWIFAAMIILSLVLRFIL